MQKTSAIVDQWDDGSTARTHAVTLFNSDLQLAAYYRTLSSGTDTTSTPPPPSPPPSAIQTLTVKAQGLSSRGTSDLSIQASIKNQTDGNIVQSGLTPVTTQVEAGTTYTVSVAGSKNAKFDQWDDGSTTKDKTITISPNDGNSTLTAYYHIKGRK